MRLDRLLVVGFGLAVLAVWAVRHTSGPLWPVVASVAGALLYLWVARRRPHPAPPPSPPHPAVLIPTHDNAGSVGEVVRGAVRHGLPVFVVDDGSVDGSGERAAAAGARVLRHAVNLGKGRALLTGMKAAADAGHTHVICLDADGQHDADDVPSFAAAVSREPGAIHVGVRDLSTAPGSSRFGRRFSNFWVWVETGWRVADTQCGFRAYPLAPVLALDLSGARYDMEVEVLTLGVWAGLPVRDLACRVYYPPPEVRVSSFRPFVDNARISWMNTRLVVERIVWPPRWFLPRWSPPGVSGAEGAPAAAWTGAARGTPLGWRIVVLWLRLAGRRATYPLVHFLAGWYTLFAVRHRHALAPYLARTGTTVGAIFRSFAVALLDRMAFLLQGPSAFTYVREGEEHLQQIFAGSSGAILLSAHLGNVEVTAGQSGDGTRMRRVKVLRFVSPEDHGRTVMAAFPPTWQPDAIVLTPTGDDGFASLAVLRALRAGQIVAMHGDRLVDDRTVTVTLLGAPCQVPSGPWMLAALAQVPVVIVGCFKEGPDTYRMVATPPMLCRFDRTRPREAQIQAWAQEYARVVEAWIRRYPEQWYNFHDVWGPGAPPAHLKNTST